MPDSKPKLSRREREVMDLLYRRGPSTVAEVMEELADPPSYSAVRSILRVLKEKGHVVHQEDGPRYVYLPAVAHARAQTAALDHLVTTFFDGSAERALAALLERSDLDLPGSTIRRLETEIRKAGEEGR
jgi:predicted transcriptional regulator